MSRGGREYREIRRQVIKIGAPAIPSVTEKSDQAVVLQTEGGDAMKMKIHKLKSDISGI